MRCAAPDCDRDYDRRGGAHGLCPRCYQRARRAEAAKQWAGYLRPGEVAEILGISVRTVERHWDARLLRGRRSARGQRWIAISSLRGYLQEKGGTTEQMIRLQEATPK